MTRMLRDDSYQETLPYHARHTASTSIKSNTRLTQFIQNEDINTGKQMNYYALENYLYNKENSFEIQGYYFIKLSINRAIKDGRSIMDPLF